MCWTIMQYVLWMKVMQYGWICLMNESYAIWINPIRMLIIFFAIWINAIRMKLKYAMWMTMNEGPLALGYEYMY